MNTETNANGQTYETATVEEVAIVGTDAPVYLTDASIVTGRSGRQYRAVNYFSEMTGDHEEALTALVAPILPTLLQGVKLATGDGAITGQMIASFDLETIATAFLLDNIDRKFVATVYLPVDDREYRAGDVEARIADLKNLTKQQVWGAIQGFFSGASSGFGATFRGSFSQMMKAL